MPTIIKFIALHLFCLHAMAEEPVSDLSNDKILAGAVLEIKSMNQNQLDSVINYIATCSKPYTQERHFHCGVSDSVVAIKTSNLPQFTKIREAIWKSDKDVASDNGPLAGILSMVVTNRQIIIYRELFEATRQRYAEHNTKKSTRAQP